MCPVALRGYLTCFVNCCWGIGQVIGIGVIKSQVGNTSHWAWRMPYALQWMWPVPLLVGVFFAPESPWWLVRRGRFDDAKKNLLRLTSLSRETDFDADETIDMMRHTTELEQEITGGASYLDCFKGTDLRRTEIVCMTWVRRLERDRWWAGQFAVCGAAAQTPATGTPPAIPVTWPAWPNVTCIS